MSASSLMVTEGMEPRMRRSDLLLLPAEAKGITNTLRGAPRWHALVWAGWGRRL